MHGRSRGQSVAGGRSSSTTIDTSSQRTTVRTICTEDHGFDKKVMNAGLKNGVGIVMRYLDDGEEDTGHRRYELTNDDVLVVDVAPPDAPTPVNSHRWNLTGHDSGTILHELQVDAVRYTPVDATLIPLGHMELVEGTRTSRRNHRPRHRAPAATWVIRPQPCWPSPDRSAGPPFSGTPSISPWSSGPTSRG